MTEIDTQVMILPGACLNLPADRAAMRQQTHDGLHQLASAAGVRPGPVTWRFWEGRDECMAVMRAAYADDDRPIKTFGLDQFEAFFEENPDNCVLIIASCEVQR